MSRRSRIRSFQTTMVKTTMTMTMRRTVATIAPRQDEAGRAGRTSGHGGSPLSTLNAHPLPSSILCTLSPHKLHLPLPTFLVDNEIYEYIHTYPQIESIYSLFISIVSRMKMKAQRLPSGPRPLSSSSFPQSRCVNECECKSHFIALPNAPHASFDVDVGLRKPGSLWNKRSLSSCHCHA